MSHDALDEFVSKLNTDETLRAALGERFGDLSGGVPADDLIAFAGEQGYSFTVDEAQEELSEDALEGVAGGFSLSGSTYLKLGDISSTEFEEIKVTYSTENVSFNFMKY